MCYTGKCKYERTWGEFVGECTLSAKELTQEDALCHDEPWQEIPWMKLRKIEKPIKKGRFRILELT